MFHRGDKKIAQILKAGQEQLPPEEFERLKSLVAQLQVYGVTPFINSELGRLISRLDWQLPEEESPEWAEALIECDRRFLGYQIKEMFRDMGYDPPRWDKKSMCRELYKLGQPQIVEIVDSFVGEEGDGEKVIEPPVKYSGIEFGKEG